MALIEQLEIINESLDEKSNDWLLGAPARKLKKNFRSLTGLVADVRKKHTQTPFESTLERDFIFLLMGASDVRSYKWQPFTLAWRNSISGKARRYTPDFGVEFSGGNTPLKPWIVEIKYHEDLKSNWDDYRESFKAATKAAMERDMVFKILTEKHIRTPMMKNMKFLLRYATVETCSETWKTILQRLRDMEVASVNLLIQSIAETKELQAQLIPHVWHLLCTRVINADLSKPLNMNTELWLDSEEEMEEGLWQMIYGYHVEPW